MRHVFSHEQIVFSVKSVLNTGGYGGGRGGYGGGDGYGNGYGGNGRYS